MFEMIKDLISKYVKEKENVIVVESETTYGCNKLEYTLSIEDYMASISILSNFTYDFFVIEIESENMLLIKTMYFNNIEALFIQLREDLEEFYNLKTFLE
jgi:hypothetical protein